MIVPMSNPSQKLTIQSGVLPLVGDSVLLITARRSGRWIIPKGNIEKGMSPAESAAKEAWEEAGVSGHVDETAIGTYRYKRPSGVHEVHVFPLRVDQVFDEWQEMHLRQRQVLAPADAICLLSPAGLRNLVAGYFAVRLEY